MRVAFFQQLVVGELAVDGKKFEPVIVIGKLHAGFLGLLSAEVKFLGGFLPIALLCGNPGADNIFHADGLGGFDDGGKFVVEFVVLHVGGDRLETVLVDRGADLLAGAAEISGKFHFLVADLCDLGDGSVEVGFHLIAHGVKLHADLFDFVLRGSPTEAAGQQSGGGDSGCGFEKGAAIHGVKTHDDVPPKVPLRGGS